MNKLQADSEKIKYCVEIFLNVTALLNFNVLCILGAIEQGELISAYTDSEWFFVRVTIQNLSERQMGKITILSYVKGRPKISAC